ncbi:hypothetical protein JZ751_015112 [Albula glossodonta]|uniref:Uncharacterized protein n=1 Tax=Albula glossodonta TaxID=121402 RepID=A0A8T2NTN6_9TELE|nr:hypothetical protein JZ751_015112 [Albula glossodonta]
MFFQSHSSPYMSSSSHNPTPLLPLPSLDCNITPLPGLKRRDSIRDISRKLRATGVDGNRSMIQDINQWGMEEGEEETLELSDV